MPIILGNIVAVTKDELLDLNLYTEASLSKNIQRYKNQPYGIKRVMIGGNGRQLLVNFDTLPGDYQEAIGDPRKKDHIMERFYRTDSDAVRYFTTFKFDDGTYLKAEHQEKYIINASVLRSAIDLRGSRLSEWKSKGKTSRSGLNQTVWADVMSFNDVLLRKNRVEHNLPGSLTRFNKTLKEFEIRTNGQFNYESLISKKHRNDNSRKVYEHTLKLLNDLYADRHVKPNATIVHRDYEAFINGYVEVVNNRTGELYDPKEYKPLSVETVNKYLSDWTSAIATHGIRSGNRQDYMGKYVPYHSFAPTEFAGSIISVDDRQPPFKTLDGKRVWFYNGIDLGSEAFTCWVYGETKEGIILEFYRQMVRNYHEWGVNLPAELEAELSLNGSFQETFLREGAMFQYVHIEANRARVKRIERYFGNLRYQYEKERNGWLPRPTALREANQAGVDISKIPAVPYEDIIDGCLADIEKWNNQPHSIHTDKTRWEVFMENQNPDLKPTNYLSILPYIGYTRPSSVKLGMVSFDNDQFLLGEDGKVALGENLVRLMQRIEGRNITVCWLDDNEGNVLKAYAYENGQLICELIQKPRYKRARIERGESDAKANETMSSYVATVNAYAKRVKAGIDGATVIRQQEPIKEGAFSIRRGRQRLNQTWDLPSEKMPQIEEDDFMAEVSNSSGRQDIRDRF